MKKTNVLFLALPLQTEWSAIDAQYGSMFLKCVTVRRNNVADTMDEVAKSGTAAYQETAASKPGNTILKKGAAD